MKIEHTRLAGFDGGPAGITWFTVGYNDKQYVVRQETKSNGLRGPYQYLLDGVNASIHQKKSVDVKIENGVAEVTAYSHDFVDVTLAVQLAKFIEEQK